MIWADHVVPLLLAKVALGAVLQKVYRDPPGVAPVGQAGQSPSFLLMLRLSCKMFPFAWSKASEASKSVNNFDGLVGSANGKMSELSPVKNNPKWMAMARERIRKSQSRHWQSRVFYYRRQNTMLTRALRARTSNQESPTPPENQL